jgi:hypothetical protein
VTLLRQLSAGGGRLRQHADFDGAGVAITSWLTERAGTSPWLMDTEEYERAVRRSPEMVRLSGRVPPTPWHPALSGAMVDAGVAVYEEQLRDGLLDAITAAAGAT